MWNIKYIAIESSFDYLSIRTHILNKKKTKFTIKSLIFSITSSIRWKIITVLWHLYFFPFTLLNQVWSEWKRNIVDLNYVFEIEFQWQLMLIILSSIIWHTFCESLTNWICNSFAKVTQPLIINLNWLRRHIAWHWTWNLFLDYLLKIILLKTEMLSTPKKSVTMKYLSFYWYCRLLQFSNYSVEGKRSSF